MAYKDTEKRKAYFRARYLANREKYAAQDKARRQKNRGRPPSPARVAWLIKNAENVRANKKDWELKNKERISARRAARYWANPHDSRARSKKRRLEQPEKVKAEKRAWEINYKAKNPERFKARAAVNMAKYRERQRAEKQSLNFIQALMWVDDLSKLKLKKQ